VRRRILSILGGVAILFAIFLLYRVFSRQDATVLWTALSSVSIQTLAIAAVFTFGNFMSIVFLEYLAVRNTKEPMSRWRIAATAVTAIGVSHAVGLAALSGAAIRYRMYGRAGSGLLFVGKVLLFSGLSTSCGFAGVGGVSLLLQADTLAPVLGTEPVAARGIGLLLLAVLVAYFACCVVSRSGPILRGRRIHLQLPKARIAALQIIGANTNVLCITGVMYTCLHGFADVSYPTVATLYVSSEVTSLIGHVPEGWGILEYLATVMLGGGPVLAGIILYRTLYYLFPLLVGLAILLIDEITTHRRRIDNSSSRQPVTNVT
jgi:uncharacterized membrane protein YbhN (UPF0104 family)